MDPLLAFGISFITAFQSLGSWLAAPMELLSFLGSEDFFLIFMPLIYWCVDAGLGVRVAFILLVSNSLNAGFKLGFQAPRPYWISWNVEALAFLAQLDSGHLTRAGPANWNDSFCLD